MSETIVFIYDEPGYMVQTIKHNIEEAGFDVIDINSDLTEIERHQFASDIIVYCLGNVEIGSRRVLKCLNGMCLEYRKTLCMIGESNSLRRAKEACDDGIITVSYKRPLDVRKFISDLKIMVGTRIEYARKKSILLVDDDYDFLQIAYTWFDGVYNVDFVNSAKEAMKYLSEKKPDLILLDHEMPKMNGYEFMSEIRKSWKTSDIPVIFLTGKDDKESVIQILEKKPDGYLLKSTPKDQLLESIDDFFANHILKIQ
ncbi:MAG: response regulator [Lachnospiraceae bacterium]|nr:response regulator [Lachnospiraceae bacterium]